MKKIMVLSLLVICYLTIGTESASCNGLLTSEERTELEMHSREFPLMANQFEELKATITGPERTYPAANDLLFSAVALQSKILLSMETSISRLNAEVDYLKNEMNKKTVAASSGRLPRRRRRRA